MERPIEDSVSFMMLPLSAQALFFHLLIRAEWDGMQHRIHQSLARDIREDIGATADDVRTLMRNEMILSHDGYIYLDNVAIYPGPVVYDDNGEKEVAIIFPGSRLEVSRQRVAKYRRESVFDFENN